MTNNSYQSTKNWNARFDLWPYLVLWSLKFPIDRHNVEKSILNITVVRCSGLPARDSNVGSSDPYVKLQLLPDKHHKVKTRVLRRTLNPVYDEDFTFYGIGENQLQVAINHQFGHNDHNLAPLIKTWINSLHETISHTRVHKNTYSPIIWH